MPIDFPNSPSVNDEFTSGSTTWRWNGSVWKVIRDFAPTGATGPTGSVGSTGATGLTGINWRAAFDFVAYSVGDVVQYSGSTYYCNTAISSGDIASHIPGSSARWDLVSAKGNNGATGLTGVTGVTGAIGATGATGAGETGATGAVGSTGAVGNTGVTGVTGAAGSLTIEQVGPTGTTESYTNITILQFDEDSGFDVTNATAGTAKVAMNSTFKYWEVDGVQQLTALGLDTVNFIAGEGIEITADGATSPQSITITNANVTGPQGEIGLTGATGITGATGVTGTTGATGDAGATGAQGETGATGATGVTGDAGDAGATGATGDAGATGLTGMTGMTGVTGATGPQGTSIDFKGSVATTETLPTGADVNDAYIVDADGNLWVWDGDSWNDAGQIVGPQGPQGNTGAQGSTGVTGATGAATVDDLTDVTITSAATGNVLVYNGSNWINSDGTAVYMGTPTNAAYLTSAAQLTTTTSVTDGIANLNNVLGKLVPAAPTNFPNNATLTVTGINYRMAVAQASQQLNGNSSSYQVAAGSTVNVLRTTTFSSSTTLAYGPGDSGIISVTRNGSSAVSKTFSTGGTNTGTTTANNTTINIATNASFGTPSGFWWTFTALASGTSVPAGWNTVSISNSATNTTSQIASWYYDSSTPGTPVVTPTAITAPVSPSYTYSSGIPMYNSSNTFALSFTATRLSGDCYPTSDTFATGTAGGAFAAPASKTYSQASVTTPLAQNLYVSSGSASIDTTAAITSGFGSSTTGPTVSVTNSYATGSSAFTTLLASTVLYKTGTSNSIEETSIGVTSVGTGSGNGYRIVLDSSSDNPAYTGSESQYTVTNAVGANDAKNVANTIKFDQTNYSTGYLPVGPNYSTHAASQYLTLKFVRSSVSKFNIAFTGTIAGLWVALPGSTIDTTAASTNGWISMATAYAGSGVPGVAGNGSAGCALGGVVTLNSAGTQSRTCTFGTESSTNSTGNEIYVRIKLTSGQSLTALSIVGATN
jgi:collagen type VII alpha